jgi:hypothetical protein
MSKESVGEEHQQRQIKTHLIQYLPAPVLRYIRMVLVPKIAFYLSLAWIMLLIFLMILIIVIAGLDYGKVAIDNYCRTWYTALSCFIVYGRWLGNYFASK